MYTFINKGRNADSMPTPNTDYLSWMCTVKNKTSNSTIDNNVCPIFKFKLVFHMGTTHHFFACIYLQHTYESFNHIVLCEVLCIKK